jgi:O-antigen ligase
MTLAPRLAALPLALVAVALGFLVSRGHGLVVVAVLVVTTALIVATLVTDFVLAAVLVGAALLAPPLGNLAGIPNITLLELLVPLLLVVLVFRAATHWPTSPTTTRATQPAYGRAIHVAVGLYALVLAFNYLRSKYLLGSVVAGVNRSYYGYFTALAAYLLFSRFFTAPAWDWSRLFRCLFWLLLIVTSVGLVAVLLKLPVSLGNPRYSINDVESGAVRIGFLETLGTAGLALVLTRKTPLRLPAGLLFAAALFESGGRTAVVGAALAIGVYLAITRRPGRVVAAIVSVALLAVAIPSVATNPQVERLAQVNQNEFSSDGRQYIYDQSISAFASSPIVGTGVGVPVTVYAARPGLAAFYETQLELGGHATYAALLKDFGLLGFLPFIAAALIALTSLASRTRADPTAGFFFILLASSLVNMFVSGNGSDPVYFFALAGGATVLGLRTGAGEPFLLGAQTGHRKTVRLSPVS